MKTILLTGGSGFIGRNIRESFLSKQYDIKAPSSTELDLLDFTKVRQYFKDNNIDTIIHSAIWGARPNSNKDINLILNNNIEMYANLINVNEDNIKMIFFGSGADFCREHWKGAMREDYLDKNVPKDDYGFSKYMISKDIIDRENLINLRLFGVFGKYEDEFRFISSVIERVLKNEEIIIGKDRYFDYMYIDDLMPILKYFIENDTKYNTYNVCTGQGVRLSNIAFVILEEFLQKDTIKIGSNNLDKEYSGDNSRLKKEFKKVKFTPIVEGIKKYIDWYMNEK